MGDVSWDWEDFVVIFTVAPLDLMSAFGRLGFCLLCQ